ncbi:hypothetical protein LguiA_013324 [Lonicera macranthoides]
MEKQEEQVSFEDSEKVSVVVSNTNSGGRGDNKKKMKEKGGINKVNEFPVGYRFCPHDHELLIYYLKNRVFNLSLPHNKIKDVNLYRHNPKELAEKYDVLGEKEWFFFTPRNRKYKNGIRPNRAAGNGYWKATGADKTIRYNGNVVGLKKNLVFYEGKPPKGDKTNWMMHEYRISDPPVHTRRNANDMRLDDWVLCKIYKKSGKGKSGKEGDDGDEAEPVRSSHEVVEPIAMMKNHDHLEMSGGDSSRTTGESKFGLVSNPYDYNNYVHSLEQTLSQIPKLDNYPHYYPQNIANPLNPLPPIVCQEVRSMSYSTAEVRSMSYGTTDESSIWSSKYLVRGAGGVVTSPQDDHFLFPEQLDHIHSQFGKPALRDL